MHTCALINVQDANAFCQEVECDKKNLSRRSVIYYKEELRGPKKVFTLSYHSGS